MRLLNPSRQRVISRENFEETLKLLTLELDTKDRYVADPFIEGVLRMLDEHLITLSEGSERGNILAGSLQEALLENRVPIMLFDQLILPDCQFLLQFN